MSSAASQILFYHPALSLPGAKRCLLTIMLLRTVFFGLALIASASLIDFGTASGALLLASSAGIVFSAGIAFSALRTRAFFIALFSLFVLYHALLWLVGLFPSEQTFFAYSLLQHSNMLFGVFCVAAFSTWMFWRYPATCSVELLILASTCIYLLSGHRDFRFDTPALVGQLAWVFGVDHLRLLIGLGVALLVCCLAYLYLSTLPSRPVARRAAPNLLAFPQRASQLQRLLALLVFGLVVSLIAQRVFSHYHRISLSLTSNGVGEASQAGLSPLGFHSALGSTNQPSALIRLEGDYAANPFSPMLYLRESALSEFNGHEMVLADTKFDQDITRTRPEESFTGKEDAQLEMRTPLVQSAFLLTEHDNAFAVDYPLSITRLKNPDRNRFKGAFRAYSVVPSYLPSEMVQHAVGDPRWDETTRQHYLKTSTDSRYAELAQQLSAGIEGSVEKAQAVVAYLSKNAIYTLTPNHDVSPDQDPVAPFLFGDLRGYCVHFAHATVYMLRALGMPARIGTGYLTDLSQSKDGHILLRMSDRHAWAEVYLQGLGWVPFDTQPEKVENHAETTVDMRLLEELMGLVGPGEEILPDDIAKDEPGLKDREPLRLPQTSDLAWALAAALSVVLLLKLYLRFAWLIPASTAVRVRRAYRAMLATLCDLGITRDNAETRSEFMQRAQQTLQLPVLGSTKLLGLQTYAGVTAAPDEVRRTVREDFAQLNRLSRVRRVLAAVNPLSVFRFLSRGVW